MEIEWIVGGSAALFFLGYWWIFRKTRQRLDSASQPSAETAPSVSEVVTLDRALRNTKQGFVQRLSHLFRSADPTLTGIMEGLEEALYSSDLGPKTVERLMGSVQGQLSRAQQKNLEVLRTSLKGEMLAILSETKGRSLMDWSAAEGRPRVWMVVGVNGAGKTTTIGKLSGLMAKRGLKVLVAAGDTFRAAAGAQLKAWTERAQVEIFEGSATAKPSGVAFDAVRQGVAHKMDLVILDTAGRLHTQANLMEELRAVRRSIEKVLPWAPDEVLLILDSNNGQNAIIQAKQFHEAVGVSAVILTKLDGTAKGGVAIGLAEELGLPIAAIGVGEKIEDLRPFNSHEFVDSIL